MKFGFSTLACPFWSVEQIVDAAAHLGYDGVEWRLLNGNVIDPVAGREQVEQAVRQCRQRGIGVCALDTSCRFNLRAPHDREAQVTSLLHWIELAHAVEVPLLRVFGGANQAGEGPVPSEDEVNSWVVAALRAAAPAAARVGVTVALETHDAFSSARRTATVLREVSSAHVGALWDSHHPYRVGETAEEVIDALGPHLVHVHVKDARRRTPGNMDWQLVLLGEGEVPVREQLQSLVRRQYQGWVCVEWEKKWHPELVEPEVALPQHIAWLKQVVEETSAV
ncbi:MAG: sugar phosphate isomerase/epimerase [Chloroflexi bacterium]|nr:sugar phosphate isomerase/epimerase [Chloroflexota bacterium]